LKERLSQGRRIVCREMSVGKRKRDHDYAKENLKIKELGKSPRKKGACIKEHDLKPGFGTLGPFCRPRGGRMGRPSKLVARLADGAGFEEKTQRKIKPGPSPNQTNVPGRGIKIAISLAV